MNELNKICIANIEKESMVDGPGIRTCIYTLGCSHHCKGCHNQWTWKLDDTCYWTFKEVADELRIDKLATNLSFSGGDPLYAPEVLLALLEYLSEQDDISVKMKDIWLWTGYTKHKLDNLIKTNETINKIFNYVSVVIPEPFVEKLRNLQLLYRGSSNQRIYKVNHDSNNTLIDITEEIESEN